MTKAINIILSNKKATLSRNIDNLIFIEYFFFFLNFFFIEYFLTCTYNFLKLLKVSTWKCKSLTYDSYDMHACSVAQSRLTLYNPMDCSPPVSSIHGILQARILDWVAISSSRGSSRPRDLTRFSCGSWIVSRFFTTEPPGKPS